MSSTRPPVVFLPGAGGAAPTLTALRASALDDTRFVSLGYPGWKRYIAPDFSPDALLQELTEQVVAIVPSGPICLLGVSLGGHLCYAVALRLTAQGREVAGICAIDSFMVSSSGPNEGWVRRAFLDAFELLKKGKISEFIQHLFSKLWRALLRLAGAHIVNLARHCGGLKTGSLLEVELSMRLLIRSLAPWLGNLDKDPVPLHAPAALLRTAMTPDDDAAWRRRCPAMEILEIRGGHQTLFDPENIEALRAAFNAATQGWPVR